MTHAERVATRNAELKVMRDALFQVICKETNQAVGEPCDYLFAKYVADVRNGGMGEQFVLKRV